MKLGPHIRSRADHDIAEAAEYIATDNVDAAIRFITAVRRSIEFLLENPGAGPRYPLSNPNLSGLRKWGVQGFGNYLIFYRMEGDTLDVIRVLHGARDLPTVLETEDEGP